MGKDKDKLHINIVVIGHQICCQEEVNDAGTLAPGNGTTYRYEAQYEMYSGRCGNDEKKNHPNYRSLYLPIFLSIIEKLCKLVLISWSRWLLQSKLHRKEFRRIGGLYP